MQPALDSPAEFVDFSSTTIQYETSSITKPPGRFSWIKDEYFLIAMITSVVLVIIGASVILALHENLKAVVTGGIFTTFGACLLSGTLYLLDKKQEAEET